MSRTPRGDNTRSAGTKAPRRGLTRALADPVREVTRKALGTRALAEAALLTEWSSIVGGEISTHCWPRRVIFPKRTERRDGTLVLRVKPGQAPRIGHQELIILDRVNAYFGYRAVARLRLEQGALPAREDPPAPPPPPLSEAETQAVAQDVEGVEDAELRDALNRLGQALRRGSRAKS
jgi:hypothetical protein